MFRVLSSLVQSVGTCLLIVGLCFQIYSLNSNRWITWVTQDANEGLFYFEGKLCRKWLVFKLNGPQRKRSHKTCQKKRTEMILDGPLYRVLC